MIQIISVLSSLNLYLYDLNITTVVEYRLALNFLKFIFYFCKSFLDHLIYILILNCILVIVIEDVWVE
jgi:hypothetical protein